MTVVSTTKLFRIIDLVKYILKRFLNRMKKISIYLSSCKWYLWGCNLIVIPMLLKKLIMINTHRIVIKYD